MFIVPSTGQPPSSTCNGVPFTDWNCCTSLSPCNLGGGDCDTDVQCASGLKCGTNNCNRDYSSAGSNWSQSADCCECMSYIFIERVTIVIRISINIFITFYINVLRNISIIL